MQKYRHVPLCPTGFHLFVFLRQSLTSQLKFANLELGAILLPHPHSAGIIGIGYHAQVAFAFVAFYFYLFRNGYYVAEVGLELLVLLLSLPPKESWD